jgi:hypothetical protein
VAVGQLLPAVGHPDILLFASEKVTFSAEKVTFSAEKVTFSGEKVTFRIVKVTFSGEKLTFSAKGTKFLDLLQDIEAEFVIFVKKLLHTPSDALLVAGAG